MSEEHRKEEEENVALTKGDKSNYQTSQREENLQNKTIKKIAITVNTVNHGDGDGFVKNGSSTNLDLERNTGEAENKKPPNETKPPKSLFFLKLIFFSTFACLGIVVSFMSLYLKQVGLNANEIGTVLFFRPLGGFVAGVMSPYIAAKLKKLGTAVMVFGASYWGSLMCINFIPQLNKAETCPDFDLYYSNFTNSTFSSKNFSHTLELSLTDRSWMFQRQWVPRIMVAFTVVLFLEEFFYVGIKTIIHGITMRILGEGNCGSFGVIRCWGAIGHGVGASVTGGVILIAVTKQKICGTLFEIADYHYVFYVLSCFCAITCFVGGNLVQTNSLESHTEQTMSNKDLWKILGTFPNFVWCLAAFCRSMFYAVTQGFLYWHMENIGASPALIGVANCITTTTEFLVFFATPKLIEVFGEWKLVMAGLVSYACRFVIFSQISNPLHILPVEVLEGVMYACIWSSIVSYFSGQVPGEAQTQVQGLIQALYMLGLACGFLLSGALTQAIGVSSMFLVFAAIATLESTFFLFFRACIQIK